MHFVEFVFSLVSAAIFVRENSTAITAIIKPLAIETTPISPNHIPPPRHLVIEPLTLVPGSQFWALGIFAQQTSFEQNMLAQKALPHGRVYQPTCIRNEQAGEQICLAFAEKLSMCSKSERLRTEDSAFLHPDDT
jgi:hypothetical protein